MDALQRLVDDFEWHGDPLGSEDADPYEPIVSPGVKPDYREAARLVAEYMSAPGKDAKDELVEGIRNFLAQYIKEQNVYHEEGMRLEFEIREAMATCRHALKQIASLTGREDLVGTEFPLELTSNPRFIPRKEVVTYSILSLNGKVPAFVIYEAAFVTKRGVVKEDDVRYLVLDMRTGAAEGEREVIEFSGEDENSLRIVWNECRAMLQDFDEYIADQRHPKYKKPRAVEEAEQLLEGGNSPLARAERLLQAAVEKVEQTELSDNHHGLKALRKEREIAQARYKVAEAHEALAVAVIKQDKDACDEAAFQFQYLKTQFKRLSGKSYRPDFRGGEEVEQRWTLRGSCYSWLD